MSAEVSDIMGRLRQSDHRLLTSLSDASGVDPADMAAALLTKTLDELKRTRCALDGAPLVDVARASRAIGGLHA